MSEKLTDLERLTLASISVNITPAVSGEVFRNLSTRGLITRVEKRWRMTDAGHQAVLGTTS
jgi:hypothetical protein